MEARIARAEEVLRRLPHSLAQPSTASIHFKAATNPPPTIDRLAGLSTIFITVTDDGFGMCAADMINSIPRHPPAHAATYLI